MFQIDYNNINRKILQKIIQNNKKLKNQKIKFIKKDINLTLLMNKIQIYRLKLKQFKIKLVLYLESYNKKNKKFSFIKKKI